MKNILGIVLVAITMIAGVEAKPEMPARPDVKVERKEMPKPKFDGKCHGRKHHAHPHRHDMKPEFGKRHYRCHRRGVRPIPLMDAPIVRPVRKPVMSKPEMNAPIVRPVRRATIIRHRD